MVGIFLIGLLFISSTLFGNQPTDTIYWIGTAESSAIGQATTAQTNASDAIFFNPAALNTNQRSSINANYSELYQTNISNFSFVTRSKQLSFGVGVHSTQSPNIERTVFDSDRQKIESTGFYNFSYSALFISTAVSIPYVSFGHIGTSIHLHRLNIDNHILQGQSVNAGVLLHPLSFITVGFVHHHLIPLKLKWKTNQSIEFTPLTTQHQLPSYSRAGIELNLFSSSIFEWRVLADYEINSNTASDDEPESPLKFGTSIAVSPIRFSMGYNSRYASLGVSTLLGHLQINYAFVAPVNNSLFQYRHSFGINYFF